jgi:hypothetical protein
VWPFFKIFFRFDFARNVKRMVKRFSAPFGRDLHILGHLRDAQSHFGECILQSRSPFAPTQHSIRNIINIIESYAEPSQ